MYFDISFIFKKSENTKKQTFDCLKDRYGLCEGENKSNLFSNDRIVVFAVDISDEEVDYDEICISFSEQIFHKEDFDSELNIFTTFVNKCFENVPNLELALCSYELNGYLLSQIKKIQELSPVVLKQFPLVYKRLEPLKEPQQKINLEAQEIFT